MKAYDSLDVQYIAVHARPGTALHDCQCDAVRLCAEEMVDVLLTHSSRLHVIRYETLKAAAEEIVRAG